MRFSSLFLPLFSVAVVFTTTPASAARAFEFIKFDASGDALPFSATQWTCVKDSTSGLIWEKKHSEGLNNAEFVSNYSNTQAYINMMNSTNFCGYDDWRLPDKDELQGLGRTVGTDSHLNTDFFPNSHNFWYWTSSQKSADKSKAWSIRSDFGFSRARDKNEKHHMRLVRD